MLRFSRLEIGNMFKNILIILSLNILLSLTVFAIYEIPEDREVITLKAGKMKNVRFTHLKHSKMKGLGCFDCHGELSNQGNIMTCTPCHNYYGKNISVKEAYHRYCIKCHKASRNKSAPVKCKDCHKHK